MHRNLTYLACPYTHHDPAVMVERFHQANKAAGRLMMEGKFVFSPISHTHPICVDSKFPVGFEFWGTYDTAILEYCKEIYVLKIPGWATSKGIASEVAIAATMNIPVFYILP